MASDLAEAIAAMPLSDTHEHLHAERHYVGDGPDSLQAIFDHYLLADLVVAGASAEAVARLVDAGDPDIRARFAGVRDAWEACQQTGYGEAARLIARLVYGLEEITPEGLEGATARHAALRRPGERLRLLREVARLDHVQIDDPEWACQPDPAGPDFFLYDLSWAHFCDGRLELPQLHDETGIAVATLADLRAAFAALFARYGPLAIAVKSQHACRRTLHWRERTEAEVAPVLAMVLAGQALSEEERLCLGDWCWARGVELAIEHNLPFKLHTGSYAGYGRMPIDRIRAGHLCGLLARYPRARFVLLHIAYPYSDELVALAKHYPNVYVDLCWAWSIDPWTTRDFVRRMIHAVPLNKLFAFGGDTFWPAASVAYAAQARAWLTRALQAEVDDRLLTERQAIAVAARLMKTNQRECFDVDGARAAIRRALAGRDMTWGAVAARVAARTVDWPCTTEDARVKRTCLRPAHDERQATRLAARAESPAIEGGAVEALLGQRAALEAQLNAVRAQMRGEMGRDRAVWLRLSQERDRILRRLGAIVERLVECNRELASSQ